MYTNVQEKQQYKSTMQQTRESSFINQEEYLV